MGTVPYPQWWVDKSAARRKALAEDVDRLRTRLHTLHGVHGVCVFGSFARNEVGPESDLDLMVVQDADGTMIDRGVKLRRAFNEILQMPYDLIVYTPTEFEEFTHKWPFAIQARAEGIWIDARSSG